MGDVVPALRQRMLAAKAVPLLHVRVLLAPPSTVPTVPTGSTGSTGSTASPGHDHGVLFSLDPPAPVLATRIDSVIQSWVDRITGLASVATHRAWIPLCTAAELEVPDPRDMSALPADPFLRDTRTAVKTALCDGLAVVTTEVDRYRAHAALIAKNALFGDLLASITSPAEDFFAAVIERVESDAELAHSIPTTVERGVFVISTAELRDTQVVPCVIDCMARTAGLAPCFARDKCTALDAQVMVRWDRVGVS